MRINDKAIVLQAIRHGDRKYIVKLLTLNHGLVTVITAAGKSQSAKIKPSYLLPLSLLDASIVLKQNKEIHQLTEASCYFVSTGFTGNISKLAIAQFINEILVKCIREQGTNESLFNFIEATIMFLNETERDYLNLHLYFLKELATYLGFEPQNNYSLSEPFFDCREGRFTSQPFSFPLGLSEGDSRQFSSFINMSVLQTPLKTNDRQNLLEMLMAYFSLHVPSFNDIKSVEVLTAVLH
jgi:DNA repair protein RecO (recombination protein O)